MPPGSFMMGSPEDEAGRYDDEGPVREVTIDRAFALGRHEVTRAEFGRFVIDTGREKFVDDEGCRLYDGKEWTSDPERSWRNPGYEQADNHPVVCVSWEDAKAYADWLSEETGETYRLPSEAEWEYAARAGSTSVYFWGNDADLACGYANGHDETSKRENGLPFDAPACDDGYAKTAPIGRFNPNAYYLHDMSGNVWEWVEDDWNETYENAPANGEAWNKGTSGRRVIRGGSWSYNPRNLRSANREWAMRFYRRIGVGFRVAKSLQVE